MTTNSFTPGRGGFRELTCTSSSSSSSNSGSEGQVPILVKSSPSDSNKSYFCRICHEGDTSEALVAPCKCTGTVALIHTTCLEHWLTTSNSDRCEICKNAYKITREPRNCLDYFHDTSNQWNVRNLIADVICFFLLTPLLIVSTYLCVLGANQYFLRERWEAVGLVILSLFLLAVYFTWCHVTTRFHISTWQSWRTTHQQIRLEPLHAANCPNPNNNTIVNKARHKRNNNNNNNHNNNQQQMIRERNLSLNRALESVGVSPVNLNGLNLNMTINNLDLDPYSSPNFIAENRENSVIPASTSTFSSSTRTMTATNNKIPSTFAHTSTNTRAISTMIDMSGQPSTIIQPPNNVTVNLNFRQLPGGTGGRGYINYSFVDTETRNNEQPGMSQHHRYCQNSQTTTTNFNNNSNSNVHPGYSIENRSYSGRSGNNTNNANINGNSTNTNVINVNDSLPATSFAIATHQQTNNINNDTYQDELQQEDYIDDHLDESDTSRIINV